MLLLNLVGNLIKGLSNALLKGTKNCEIRELEHFSTPCYNPTQLHVLPVTCKNENLSFI